MVNLNEDVKRALDALGWWKLVWRAGDAQEVTNAAIRQQCKDPERMVR